MSQSRRPILAPLLALLWLAQGVFLSAWHHHGPACDPHRPRCEHHHVGGASDHEHEASGGSATVCDDDHGAKHSPGHDPAPAPDDDCSVCHFLAKQPLPYCAAPLLQAAGVVQAVTPRPTLQPASKPLLIHHARAPPARI